MRQIMGMLMVGMAVDRLLGDPQGWYHPVRTMGTWIASGERWLRAIFPKTARGELAGGAALCAFVLILSGGIPACFCGRRDRSTRLSASSWEAPCAGSSWRQNP